MTDIDKHKCPECRTFELLLTGALSEHEEHWLAKHLDECATCRHELEQATEGAPLDLEMLDESNSEIRVKELELATRIKQKRIRAQSKSELAETFSEADGTIPLDFLEPSDNDQSLGRLGPYEITEVIGRGGMGVVLRGHDPTLSRVVAIKVLAPELAVSATARRRFLREAQAAAAVSHNHLVTIHAVDEAASPPYLVMEYVHGRSLQQRIDEEGPLELNEIVRIGIQVAGGLAAAHAQGLVHRDIKPSNIMLEKSVERVKITDFGLARAVDDENVTRTGETTGTPLYMSPEQALGGTIDHRSDLFSMGSVLYTMCTGRPPFRADCSVGVLRRVCDDQSRPICEVNPEIPEWLQAIVDRLLAKSPERRFQSADEVADRLGRHLHAMQNPWASHPPTEADHDHTGQAWAASSGRGVFWRGWLLAATVLIVLVMVLGVTEATGITHVSEFVATVLRIRTPGGTLIVQIDDPNVQVAIKGDGGVAIAGAGPQEVRLDPGQYRLEATKDGDSIYDEWVTIEQGHERLVHVALEPSAGEKERRAEKPEYSLIGNDDGVHCLAFSPDGQRLAVAGGQQFDEGKWGDAGDPWGRGTDYAIRIYDVPTGTELRRLAGHRLPVRCVCFSPDGRRLLSGSEDTTVRFWDVASGREIQRFTTHGDWVSGVAFSPSGSRALTCDYRGRVLLWNLKTQTLERRLVDHAQRVYSVAFSPNGSRAVSAGGWGLNKEAANGDLRIWDVATGEVVRRLQGHQEPVWQAIFHPDGRRIISCSADQTIRIWDAETAEQLQLIYFRPGWPRDVTVLPGGRRLLTCSWNHTSDLALCSIETGVVLQKWATGAWAIDVDFYADRHLVASGGLDRHIYLRRLPEGLWSNTPHDSSAIDSAGEPRQR